MWLNRRQEDGETFEEFQGALAELAEDAEIANMSYDDWMTTRLIHGISDEDVRQELLGKTPSLDLAETIRLCKNKELARKDRKK